LSEHDQPNAPYVVTIGVFVPIYIIFAHLSRAHLSPWEYMVITLLSHLRNVPKFETLQVSAISIVPSPRTEQNSIRVSL
jgi:hypothetical protein